MKGGSLPVLLGADCCCCWMGCSESAPCPAVVLVSTFIALKGVKKFCFAATGGCSVWAPLPLRVALFPGGGGPLRFRRVHSPSFRRSRNSPVSDAVGTANEVFFAAHYCSKVFISSRSSRKPHTGHWTGFCPPVPCRGSSYQPYLGRQQRPTLRSHQVTSVCTQPG